MASESGKDASQVSVANQVPAAQSPVTHSGPRRRLPGPTPPAREQPSAEDLAKLYLHEDEIEPQPEPQPETTEERAVPPVATEPPPPAPKHSPFLSGLARDLGLTQDEIDAESPASLESVVRHLTRRRPEASPATDPASQPVQAAPQQPRAEEVALDFGLDDEGQPLTLAPGMKQLLEKMHAKLGEQERQLAELRQGETVRQAKTVLERVDQEFASLGAAYERVIGKGGAKSVSKSKPHVIARNAVTEYAGVLTGLPKPTWDDIIPFVQQAAKELFGGGVQTPAPAPTTKPVLTEEDLETAALGRPTSRKAPLPAATRNGQKKEAVEAVASKLREYGQGDEDDDDRL